MWKPILSICCVAVFLLTAGDLYAHGGGHSKPAQQEKKAAPEENPRAGDEPEMKHAPAAAEQEETIHLQHQIKLGIHELVSPSKKGYAVAVGITILAGALFGILSFRRKEE